MNTLTVHSTEDGMKLLQFLGRKLGDDAPPSLLHRWIRTGQIRVNSGRTKPFTPVHAGDIVRLPPFAQTHSEVNHIATPDPRAGESLGPELRILAVTENIIALVKQSGFPTQPGSGWNDSAATRLATRFHGLPYVPAPAHRLDKATSGILLAGRTHKAQQQLHEWFAASMQAESSICKEYLAWVHGEWPYPKAVLLEDTLTKSRLPNEKDEKVHIAHNGEGKEAWASATRIAARTHQELGSVSLLRLTLYTGRTHQLRVQLSTRGFPIIGDTKYQGPKWARLLLHAWRISLPSGDCFTASPGWAASLPLDNNAATLAFPE